MLRRDGPACPALVAAKVNDIDEALIAQVVERVAVDVEVVFGDDPEGADGGQRAAVLAVQLVDAITINDQLPLLAARQVEVVHQAVARIVVVPVTPPALVFAQQATAVDPSFWIGYYQLAAVYEQLGNSELALKALEEGFAR